MNPVVIACAIAFLGGAFYESACVFWVHYSEKGRPYHTAFMSMLCATAEVSGLVASVHTLIAAPFFIVGYGTGTWLGVSIKKHRLFAEVI